MIEILLATYNGERFLQEQLDSIFSQSAQNFHLLIRDDGSTDRTLDIIHTAIKQYPEKITLLSDRSHLGAIKSFSELMCASKAPYVMFADQDDVWLKDKILVTFEKIRQMEEVFGRHQPLLVHTDLKVVDEDLSEISPSYWSYSHLKPREGTHLNRLVVQNEITGCTVMLNRPLIDLACPIFPDCVMHDWWLGLVAAAFGHIGFINKPLILYRQHGKNTLGAKKFGLALIRDRSQIQEKKQLQVHEFHRRYETILSKGRSDMLVDYLSMKESSFLRNRFLMFKHKFFKHGILRNLYSIIFKEV